MDIHHYASRYSMPDLADAALVKAQSIFAHNDEEHEDDLSSESNEDDEQKELQVSSLPRPIKTTLPGPMQLFSATINASATPAIAVLDQPSSMESSITMQPQLNAIFQKTTAAKRIATTEYHVSQCYLCTVGNIDNFWLMKIFFLSSKFV